jgi:hypothetical protein
MADRRSARSSHVRPRPPSSGRPAPAKVRPRAPAPGRLAVHTPIRRSHGVPLIGRFALAIGVIALGVGVLYVGAGGLGTVAGAVGETLGGFVDDVTATPTPEITPPPFDQSPRVASPEEPYTNQSQVDLVVTVDQNIVGDPDRRLRVYLALEGQSPAPIQEAPLAPTPQTIVPVTLTEGINDFMVTVVGPGGESEASPIVRYVLDQEEPGIKIASPKDGATVNRQAVDIEGRTQARSTLQARNADTGESIGGTAGTDGAWSLRLPLANGRNRIVLTATDPAGNSREAEFVVNRGSGKLTASLSADAYRIKQSRLPEDIQLTATVDDPDGRPLPGAKVTFTLSIPGLQTITSEVVTDANGTAVFTTTIAKGADKGGGSAAILVRTSDFGRTTDNAPITITK